jgi:heptosyltransferase-2
MLANADTIAIHLPNHVGDAVMALPALSLLRLLRLQNGQPGPWLIARPMIADLLEVCLFHEQIMRISGGIRGLADGAAQIRTHRIATGYVMAESFRSALLMRLGGSRTVRGKSCDGRSLLLTPGQRLDATSTSHLHRTLEYCNVLGVPATDAQSAFLSLQKQLQTSLLERRNSVPKPLLRVEDIAQSETKPHRLLVGVFPGAARGQAKMWPADNFAAVINELRRTQTLDCMMLGASSEKERAQSACDLIHGSSANLCGSTDLVTLMQTLQQCDLVLANDSGGAHLAALVGTPVVVIFGATDPKRTAPMGTKVQIVSAGGPKSERIASSSRTAKDQLSQVTPDMVTKAAHLIIESNKI